MGYILLAIIVLLLVIAVPLLNEMRTVAHREAPRRIALKSAQLVRLSLIPLILGTFQAVMVLVDDNGTRIVIIVPAAALTVYLLVIAWQRK